MTAKDAISPQIVPLTFQTTVKDGEKRTEGNYFSSVNTGSVDPNDAASALARLFPPLDEFTELTITCRAGQYSASAIAHAVEDADAHLLNLNVVGGTYANSDTTIVIRVNHSRGDSVARSLLRYGYETIDMKGTSGMPDSEMVDKIKELLHYIEV